MNIFHFIIIKIIFLCLTSHFYDNRIFFSLIPFLLILSYWFLEPHEAESFPYFGVFGSLDDFELAIVLQLDFWLKFTFKFPWIIIWRAVVSLPHEKIPSRYFTKKNSNITIFNKYFPSFALVSGRREKKNRYVSEAISS